MITILVFLITTHFYVFVIDKDGLFGKYKSKYRCEYDTLINYWEEKNKEIIENQYYALKYGENKNFISSLEECLSIQKALEKTQKEFSNTHKNFKSIVFVLPKWLVSITSGFLIITMFILGFTGEQEFRIVKFLIGFIPHHSQIIEFCCIISCIIVIIEILLFKNATKKLEKHYNLQKKNLNNIRQKSDALSEALRSLESQQLKLDVRKPEDN